MNGYNVVTSQFFSVHPVHLRGHGKSFSAIISASNKLKEFVHKNHCSICETHLCQECEWSKLMCVFEESVDVVRKELL